MTTRRARALIKVLDKKPTTQSAIDTRMAVVVATLNAHALDTLREASGIMEIQRGRIRQA